MKEDTKENNNKSGKNPVAVNKKVAFAIIGTAIAVLVSILAVIISRR